MRLFLVNAAVALAAAGAVPALAQFGPPSTGANSSQAAGPNTQGTSGAAPNQSSHTATNPYRNDDMNQAGAAPQQSAQNRMYRPNGTTGAPPYGSSVPGPSQPPASSGTYQDGTVGGGTTGGNVKPPNTD
jgi:hypothetical protein